MVSNFNSQPQPPFPGGNGYPPVKKTGFQDNLGSPTLPKTEEDSLNLRQALSVLRRRWWLMLLVAAAVTSGMSFRVLNEPPLYQSQFRLLVEPIAGEASFDQFSQRLIGELGLELDYESQIEVLRSPTILNPILEKIQEKYPAMDYDGLVGSLAITRIEMTKILEISYQDSDPEKIKFVLDQLSKGFVEYSQKEQKTGKQKGLQFVNKQLPELEKRVDELQAKVQKFRQDNDLIDPAVQGQAVADYYSDLQKQRQATETELAATEALNNKLKSQLNVDLEEAITATALSEATRYQNLLNRLQEVETEIALESARFTDKNPRMQALRDRKENLMPLIEKEARSILGRTQDPEDAETDATAKTSPDQASDSEKAETPEQESEDGILEEVNALNTSPNSIRLKLTQSLIETMNQEQVLTAKKIALAEAEEDVEQELEEFAVLNRQYTDLQRQLEVATESLKRFLSVQEDLQIESAQHTMSWDMINAPKLPQYPIAPNVSRGLLLGLVAGLLAGAGAALIAEKLDVRFHSPDDLKDSVGLPLLGIIPYRKDFKARKGDEKAAPLPPLAGRYRASPFMEAFRSLNANLSFFTPDKPLQALLVSSSVPLEGKSTTSVNLAQAAAAMGQRVLLIDADLRRPQIHAMTDLPNVWGLSHVISMDIEVEDVIQRSPNDDNLFILTAGQIPPDPTRLLSSQKMRSLIERFRQSFDLVVFDTPPMLGLADAKFLASQVDVMLMVVRLGWTDRTVFKQVIDNIKVSQTSSSLGLIANGAKDLGSGSYYYYHRYFSSQEESSFNG